MFPGTTPAERDAIHADALVALFETCTIRRRDQAGAWQMVAAGVPCRMRLKGQSAQAFSEATASGVAPCVTALPAGTDVRRHDRITSRGRVMTVEVVEPEVMVHTMAHGMLQAVEAA